MYKKGRSHIIIITILCLSLIFSGCSGSKESVKDTTAPDSYTTETVKTEIPTGSKPASDPVEPSIESKGSSSDDTGSYGTMDKTMEPAESYISESKVAESPSIALESGGTYDSVDGAKYSLDAKRAYGDESDGAFEYSIDEGAAISEADGDFDPYIPSEPVREAGILTAGEWNDNKNYDFLKKLIKDGQSYTYKNFFTNWDLNPFNRLVVLCQSATGSALTMAKVTVTDKSGNPIWEGMTDHEGYAYAYYGLLDPDMMPSMVKVEYDGLTSEYEVHSEDLLDTSVITINLSEAKPKARKLDLMFTVDTTGSMGDEISYLQAELKDVIQRVKNDSKDIPLRLSVNFYRDVSDDYVVRSYEFSDNIDEQLSYLSKEYAGGGGDYEEAVETALDDCVNNHNWDEDSIKLLFLVLDAPPHNTEDIRSILKDTLAKASEQGIRIIPVASSGIDKDTEFLLRAFAMSTGGTYTFLTDHSGVGDSHIEPTVGEYKVEQLNDMLVRIIETYIG